MEMAPYGLIPLRMHASGNSGLMAKRTGTQVEGITFTVTAMTTTLYDV